MQPKRRLPLLLGLVLLGLAVVLVVIGSRRPSRDEVVRAKGKPPVHAPEQGAGP